MNKEWGECRYWLVPLDVPPCRGCKEHDYENWEPIDDDT